MANKVMSMFAEMGMDSSKFSSGMDKATSDFNRAGDDIRKGADRASEAAMDSFNSMVEDAGSSFDLLGSIATGVFTGMTSTAIDAAMGIASMFMSAFNDIAMAPLNMAMDYDEAMGLIATKTGETGDMLDWLGESARNVWKNNFADSVTEAADAIANVNNMFKDMEVNNATLEYLTESAFGLQDAFGADMDASLNATKVLMDKFGLSAVQAMDFITKGYQEGMDASGDFLDSVSEYGNLFAESGSTADQFFSILNTGMQGGVLGTDKAADAFKEFQIRFLEGGDEVSGAMTLMGMSYDDLIGSVSSGKTTTVDAFNTMVSSLASIQDPILQNQMGIALFGTMWEDMGASAMLAIDSAKFGMEDLAGAGNTLSEQYNTLPGMWETIKRGFLDALIPMGTDLLDSIIGVMPDIQAGFELFQTDVLPIITDFVAQGTDKFDELIAWIRDEGIPMAIESFYWFRDEAWPAIQDFADQATDRIMEFAEWFQSDMMPVLEDAWVWWNDTAWPAIQDFTKMAMPILDALFFWIVDVGLKSIMDGWKWWTEVAYPTVADFVAKVRAVIDPWIEEFTTAWEVLGPKFQEAWDKMKDAVGRLFDALQPLLGDEGMGGMGEGVDLFDAALAALSLTLDIVIPVLTTLATMVGNIATGLDTMVGWVEKAVEAWKKLKDILDKIKFPDSILPGSLPPAAEGLKMITDELAAMNLEFGPTASMLRDVGRGAQTINQIRNDNRQNILQLNAPSVSTSTIITSFSLLESIS